MQNITKLHNDDWSAKYIFSGFLFWGVMDGHVGVQVGPNMDRSEKNEEDFI